jgi:hypothetical protein
LAAEKTRWKGVCHVLFLLVTSLTCFAGAYALPQWHDEWTFGGPVMLFLSLLTLINAPFDWASVGLTRALLRRGLDLGGWWPYVLSSVDALCAAGIITILTVVSVLSIQLFDDIAVHSAGEGARVLPLVVLFDGIETNPSAPEFWWVYAMLLSTMIPSLVKLMIGGASLVRGIPWITKLLLDLMPEGGMVSPQNREWISVLLTAQVFVGAAIGVVAQVVLAYVVIGWVLRLFGLDLLELARAVAPLDAPGPIIQLVFGSGVTGRRRRSHYWCFPTPAH